MMVRTHSALMIRAYQQSHKRLLQVIERLDDEQLAWRPASQAPSLAFHFWHVARWADHLQAALPGMTPALAQMLGPGKQWWESEGLVTAWGWTAETLGFDATGMHMSDEAGAQLTFPPKAELLAYMERVFAIADAAVGQLDDALLLTPEQRQQSTEGIFGNNVIGDAIMTHITHDNRHLGMIEGLLGILTGKGTATV